MLEYILFLPIRAFLLYTPAVCAYVCAKILGKVAYRVARIRRRVVMQNLATAFGEELDRNASDRSLDNLMNTSRLLSRNS